MMTERRPSADTDYDHRLPQNPATVPAGVALDTQIGLAAFRAASSQSERAFAQTEPMPAHGAVADVVHPAAAAGDRAASGAGDEEPLDVATAMVVCRRNGRAAPGGAHWDALVARFLGSAGGTAALPGAAELAHCSRLEQRVQLRQLLIAAHHQHRLPELLQVLAAIPEAGWTHMGD